MVSFPWLDLTKYDANDKYIFLQGVTDQKLNFQVVEFIFLYEICLIFKIFYSLNKHKVEVK